MTPIDIGPRTGKLAGIAPDPAGWVVVYQDEADGAIVLVQLSPEGSLRAQPARIPNGPPSNAWPVVQVVGRDTWIGYRQHTAHLDDPIERANHLRGVLWNLTRSARMLIGDGPGHTVDGNAPIVIGPSGLAAAQVGPAFDLWFGQLPDALRPIPPYRGAGTGLARIDGVAPVLVDVARASVPGMVNPQHAPGIVVGENADNGQARVIARLDDGRQAELWPGLDSPLPKVAAGWGGFAVVASGGPGVRVMLCADADFARPVVVPVPERPPAAPVPDPPRPPVPPAAPAHPPKESNAMELSDRAVEVIAQYVSVFPPPLTDPPGAAKEEAFRDYMRGLAGQLAATVDQRFGCKSAGGGRPRSKDAVALHDGQTLWAWDIFSGVGTGNTQLRISRRGLNLTIPSTENDFVAPQDFEAVPAVDRLGAGAAAPGPGPADPKPPTAPPASSDPEVVALLRQLLAAQGTHTAVLERVAAGIERLLEASPAAPGDPGDVLEALRALGERVDGAATRLITRLDSRIRVQL